MVHRMSAKVFDDMMNGARKRAEDLEFRGFAASAVKLREASAAVLQAARRIDPRRSPDAALEPIAFDVPEEQYGLVRQSSAWFDEPGSKYVRYSDTLAAAMPDLADAAMPAEE